MQKLVGLYRRVWHNWLSIGATVVLVVLFVSLFRPSSTSLHALSNAAGPVKLGTSNAESLPGRLLLVQAVFRHGARTPLSNMYYPDTEYSGCDAEYPGVELKLKDETGLPDPPPILDMNEPLLPGGCRMGQLTRNGYKMTQELGQYLRRKYVDQYKFLDTVFTSDQVKFRTTCVQRAVQSLQGVVSGLYPGLHGPVVADASLERFEYEYGKNTTCPRLGPLHAQLEAALAVRDSVDVGQYKLMQVVREELKMPEGKNLSWVRLRDTLSAMEAEGLPLPEGASRNVMQFINRQAMLHEASIIAPLVSDRLASDKRCHEVIRLGIGPLVWRLLNNMEQAVAAAKQQRAASSSSGAGSRRQHLSSRHMLQDIFPADTSAQQQQQADPETEAAAAAAAATAAAAEALSKKPLNHDPRMVLFSGHDSTVTPLLAVLGKPEIDWPPFAANVVLELWERPKHSDGPSIFVDDGKGGGEAVFKAADSDEDADVQYDVRMLYNHAVMFIRRSKPGGWVSIHDFKKAIKDYIAADAQHQQECQDMFVAGYDA